MTVRVGQGFDTHPFVEGRPLVLGGVVIEHSHGLDGHSDADVVAHAVADALLGAACLGDLGTMFPASDEQWAGADSLGLLAHVAERVQSEGWAVGNVDAALVAEVPKLAPHVRAMELKLGAVVGAPVSVKPKRAEGLGAIGRSEGIACWAVALIERP